MNPDPYRGLWGGYRDSPVQSLRAGEAVLEEGGTVCSSSRKYITQLEELLDFCIPLGKPAAFFAESIQVRENHGMNAMYSYCFSIFNSETYFSNISLHNFNFDLLLYTYTN